MNDMIIGLGLKGPGWRIGIDLEEYLQRSNAAQLRRLLKLLDTAESHNALEPVSCGDPATGTPRILAAALTLEAELPEMLHNVLHDIAETTEELLLELKAKGETKHVEHLRDRRVSLKEKQRRLLATQKKLAAHKELIEKWIQTQK